MRLSKDVIKGVGSCLTASLFFFYVILQMNLYNSLNNQIVDLYHLTPTVFGFVSSLYFYFAAIFLIPAGLLIDYVSNKKLLIVLLFLMSITALLNALTINTVLLSLYRIASGIGNSFAFLLCMRTAVLWFPKRSGLAIGWCITIGMLGGVAQSPFYLTYSYFGWHYLMLVNGGLGLFILLLGFFCYRQASQREIIPNVYRLIKSVKIKLISVIRNWKNALCGIYTGLLNLPVMTLSAAWGSAFLYHAHHISQASADFVIGMIYVGMIVSSPVIGGLADNYKSKRPFMMALGSILSILCISVIIYVTALSVWMLAILFFILGAVTTAQIISYPIVGDVNNKKNAGIAMSWVSVLIYLIGAFSNNIFGWMLNLHNTDKTVTYTSFDYQFAMSTLLASFFVALLVALVLYKMINYQHNSQKSYY